MRIVIIHLYILIKVYDIGVDVNDYVDERTINIKDIAKPIND